MAPRQLESSPWRDIIRAMTATELKAAQDELVAVASQIESELQGGDYLATQEELRIVDAAIASIDSGEAATDAEVTAAFAKFGSV
jgi:hypothetical protein